MLYVQEVEYQWDLGNSACLFFGGACNINSMGLTGWWGHL